jgi:hypothetical protein
VAFEMLTNGQSPGKKRMRIRVVKEGGGLSNQHRHRPIRHCRLQGWS